MELKAKATLPELVEQIGQAQMKLDLATNDLRTAQRYLRAYCIQNKPELMDVNMTRVRKAIRNGRK